MGKGDDKGPLLGQQVSGSRDYDPGLLFPVPRANARSELPGASFDGFGEDVWQCYELSWLDAQGSPEAQVGLITVPAQSPHMVESKSLKLYLNSLYARRFEDSQAARSTIARDLAQVVGDEVAVELLAVDAPALAGGDLHGECLDSLAVTAPPAPDAGLLVGRSAEDARLYTHRLRSLCPVTAQPDWATVVIETRGVAPEPSGLMEYLLGFREHQEFHEHCVERIFVDLRQQLNPAYLSVHALYTRRGGIAICPWRCTEPRPAPRYRLNRQ